jgi:hypothetical protein
MGLMTTSGKECKNKKRETERPINEMHVHLSTLQTNGVSLLPHKVKQKGGAMIS